MKHKSIFVLVLAVVLIFAMSAATFAATSTKASVPVTLSVSNEYRSVNVTVPASLPVEVVNGTVLTADNAGIVNNSQYSAVQVTNISVTKGAFSVGNYNNFSGKKTIALKINGCPTKGGGNLSLTSSAFPRIEARGILDLNYDAKVSKDAENMEDVKAANVVITISIVD